MSTNILFGLVIFSIILLVASLTPLGIWASGAFEFTYDTQRIVMLSLMIAAIAGTVMAFHFGPKWIKARRDETQAAVDSTSHIQPLESYRASRHVSLPPPITPTPAPKKEAKAKKLPPAPKSSPYVPMGPPPPLQPPPASPPASSASSEASEQYVSLPLGPAGVDPASQHY